MKCFSCVYTVSTHPDVKHELSPRAVVPKLIANADNVITQHGDPHYGSILRCFCTLRRIYMYKVNFYYLQKAD